MSVRSAVQRYLWVLLPLFFILPTLAACDAKTEAPPPTPAGATRLPSLPSPTKTPTVAGPVAQPTPSPVPSPDQVAVQGRESYPSLNAVRSLAFAPDGSLWAGTGSGVVRWDLATDSHVRYSTAGGLVSDDVTDLAFAPDGTLWVAARGGVSHFDGTTWTGYTEADGLASNIANAIAPAPDGLVWVGTQNGASYFDGSVWTRYTTADGLAGDLVWYVAVGGDGDVWFSTHTGGVSRYNPERDTWTTYGTQDGLPVPNARALAIGPDGAPWLHIGYDHVYRFDGTTWQVAYEASGGRWVCDMAFDAGGLPWIATCGGLHAHGLGLAHFDGTTWTHATTADGLIDNDLSAVAVAPNGTVAAGTDRGLGAYQNGQWRTLRSGPTQSRVTAIAVTPDGAAWFGFGDDASPPAGGGLSRFDGQAWQYFLGDANVRALAIAPDGALWAGMGCDVHRFDGTAWARIGQCGRDLPAGYIFELAFAPDGTAWVANRFSLARFDGRSWTTYEKLANSLAVARDGTVWINGWTGSQGSNYLAHLDGQKWTTYRASDGFPGTFQVGAATPDGLVWGIAPERGLGAFDGQSWTSHPISDPILDLVAAPDGVPWAITEAGLARFDGQAWQRIQFDEGRDTIHAMAFAPDGDIWLGTLQGAIHFRLSEALSPAATGVTPTATPVPPASTPTQRDCTGPNAFPTEEATLIWPELREVQPARAAPGAAIRILGTGGHLYWQNECGQFWLESAREFHLFFDGQPLGVLQCYANTCVADLTVPADAAPGTRVISVEGGSNLNIEISDD